MSSPASEARPHPSTSPAPDEGAPRSSAPAIPRPEELGFDLPEPGATSKVGIVVVIAVLAAGGLAFRWFHQRGAHGDPVAAHGEGATKVDVIKPNTLVSASALTLPGIARSFEETKIYPRTTGYVRRWLVDIGDKVAEGQLLAEIDTPDLDAQLSQGRAQLAQARAAVKQYEAQRNFSKSNATRNQNLADQKLIAGSTLEQTQAQALSDEATLAASQSNVASQEANVRRLGDLQGFAKVTAPFAGTITTRSIERGALLTDTGATPMYTLVASDPIRVFIDVPQTVAASMKVGTVAEITVRELPGRKLPGKIARASGALDPALHTMTTEIDVPNGDGALLPGMYVQAALTLPVPHKVVEIPATALYSDAQGVRVAVIDAQHKAHFAPITIERDTGATLWVATGLTGDEKIVKVAVPSLLEGDLVETTK